MIGIEFLISFAISAVIVYFIRKKLKAKKQAKEGIIPLRQKDIKKAKKLEKKNQK